MDPNELPKEIRDAARSLCDVILADPQGKAFRTALFAFESDLRISALEKRVMDMYADLTIRRQKGETLEQSELDRFYELRSEYYGDPLVVARNDALGALKPLLAEAREHINAQLGLDFSELAKIK